jgi:hypothetical protein
MTDITNNTEPEGTEAAGIQMSADEVAGHVYVYESAGIAERDGHVPVWLWVVVATLLIWGVYYLVTYWNVPLATG